MHGAGADTHDGLRRAPVQRRSAARLARILDACAELLDETGYEELSTRAVADRAGVPIGSVYRFFGNKRDMADALARRNLDSYVQRVERRLAAIPAADWRSAIDAVLDEYLAMKRTVPGFGLVDFGTRIPVGAPGPAPAPTPAGEPVPDPNHRVADRLTTLLAAQLRRAPDAALRRTVLVAVEAADALFQLAFRSHASGDPDVIAETRELVRAYLARTLD
ncbi:TetR/AcrR family transcriptional regulator [Streptomyces sp. IB2014 016-6]|uniref:TetR/AcrR family transcriptional regulator n=1 Tax=Streptomyces sp. IB2014 016-6 TaxID=2517818 RepID=UPI0011CA104D|nr:TetR/AcrR family transcriptional regulator [Streptomyces sp. IB2014 016-6]TXL86326.1 TetR/AcrR family transcriptional regulator [Streptomyces sp. IB2014 016-6]